jgi:hypothetical protein
MNCAVEVGPGGMIYVPSLIKSGLGVQKLMGGLSIQTQRQQGDRISLVLFLKLRKVDQKILYELKTFKR